LLLVTCLTYSSTLKMEAISCPEMSANLHETGGRHIQHMARVLCSEGTLWPLPRRCAGADCHLVERPRTVAYLPGWWIQPVTHGPCLWQCRGSSVAWNWIPSLRLRDLTISQTKLQARTWMEAN
jgi:hypothetical protein